MGKNIAVIGRREVEAHRRWITGVTASRPSYTAMDAAGHKEWVVDVYVGPIDLVDLNIIQDVPIAPYAKELVTDLRQPVTLERSKQGKYTVIGRAKVIASGSQTPEETILDATYHFVTHNLSDLRALHVADLDWEFEAFQETGSTPFQADPEEPFQDLRAWDAFGNQVAGVDAEDAPGRFATVAEVVVKTRHVKIGMAKFGPPGDPEAMSWGVSVFQPVIQVVVESP